MHEGLKNNIREWPTNQQFANFLQHNTTLSPLQQDEQAKKVDAFLRTCLDRLNKNFSRWANDFLVCTIGGEAICAKYVVKYLLKIDDGIATNITYHSEFHGLTFDIDNFCHFIKDKCVSHSNVMQSNHLTQFAPEALQLISSGEQL